MTIYQYFKTWRKFQQLWMYVVQWQNSLNPMKKLSLIKDRPRKGWPRVPSAAEDKFITVTSLRNRQLTAHINPSQSPRNSPISTSTGGGECVTQPSSMTQNTPPGYEWTIRPRRKSDGVQHPVWDGLGCRVKENQSSPSVLLENPSSWLPEIMPKLSSKEKLATLKNIKYKMCLVYTFCSNWIPILHVFFNSFEVFNVENNQNKEKHWIRRCVQTRHCDIDDNHDI